MSYLTGKTIDSVSYAKDYQGDVVAMTLAFTDGSTITVSPIAWPDAVATLNFEWDA